LVVDDRLAGLLRGAARVAVLTGAGISAESGIPTFRDAMTGLWASSRPEDLATRDGFRRDPAFVWGWYRARRLAAAAAEPNAGHRALVALESQVPELTLVTQNVDGLHQRAGSRGVLDLHGRLDVVVCLGCGTRTSRADVQAAMAASNAHWDAAALPAPDGDADIDAAAVDSFHAPRGECCGGLLKPDVVFFGENVPGARYDDAREALARADALLVAGSSLMVYSGFRFVRQAHDAGLPIAIVNRGRTRGDEFADLKVEGDVGTVLTQAIDRR
jgi:NAD-dependent SIR2 family protein deacetylase